MSTVVGTTLPGPVLDVLAPEESLRPEGQCIVLVTVDPDGQPRPCLLSVGELLAMDDRRLRTAVWQTSRTTANLDRGSPALLVVAAPPDAFHIRTLPRRLPDAPPSPLARFELDVISVEVDGHDGLPVTQPMWFAAKDGYGPEVLAMWRRQHASLRA